SEDRAAADPVRGLAVTLTCAAGALLLPRLDARAAYLAHAPGRRGARAALGELPLHDLPQEVLVHFGAEDLVGQIDLPNVVAGGVLEIDFHGGVSGLDLDVDAGREVELHQRVEGLLRRLEDVEQTLVGANLELLARLLVGVRR